MTTDLDAGLSLAQPNKSLPKSIQEARRRAAELAEQQILSKAEENGSELLALAWERIFESLPTDRRDDSVYYKAWLQGWARRLATFGKLAVDAGFASNINALNSNNLEIQIGHDLLKSALDGEVEPIFSLLQSCPKPFGSSGLWWPKLFNHDLPLQIYDPQQASLQPKNCVWCANPLAEEDIQDNRGVCAECRNRDDKMVGLQITVRSPEAAPENPYGLMARVGEIGRQIRLLCSQRFGTSLTESDLLDHLEAWLLEDGYVDDQEQLARLKLADVLELLCTGTKGGAPIGVPMLRQSISEFAKQYETPIDVLRAAKSSSPTDWAAAVYVYRTSRELPQIIPKPAKFDFAKLELAIDERHAHAWRQNGILRGTMILADDPKYELSKKIDSEFSKELATLRGLMPPPVKTPAGWEDDPPKEEITSISKLREYLEERLDLLRTFGIGNHVQIMGRIVYEQAVSAIRNTWRILDHLKIDERPSPLPDDPTNAYDAERVLSNLILWLRTEFRNVSANSGGSKERPGRKASYQTVEKEAQIASEWEQARKNGVPKVDFAEDKKMTVKKLDALLDRVFKRKTRSDK